MWHSRYVILLTHIPFVPCWSALLFLRYSYFKNWPWRSKVKVMGEVKIQGHNESSILSTHTPLVPCELILPFLRYSIFKIWPWKSKVKVIAQGHKVDITPYRLTSLSLHVNRPSHSCDTAISKFDVEKWRSRSWVRSKFKITTLVQHPIDSHPFGSMSIHPLIPMIELF